MSQTVNEVMDSLHESLDSVETEASDLAGGVRAVIPEDEIGRAMGVLRRSEYDYEAKRDPSGENLVVNIEADERKGLEELFR